ncbi:MAG: hypothetical protein ABI876_09205 [Bacteroidota bacterium]
MMADHSPITTLTVFQFSGRLRRLWAFAQMGLARPLLRNVPGLRFHRLMGMGRGIGFSALPDPGRYAVLGVWESHADARRFLDDSRFIRRYRRHAAAVATVALATISAHGTWGGSNPFLPISSRSEDPSGPVAVLTRARIRLSRLRAFWSFVAPVRAELAAADGLQTSVGVGEAPLILQATFSIWRDVAAMEAFAYRMGDHREAVRRTRDEGWYAEELFARFAVVERSEIFP